MDASFTRINLVSLFANPDELADFCMLDSEARAAKLTELLADGIGAERLVCDVNPSE